MSLSNEFQVCLPSNVDGNPDNNPSKYETTLARSLELGGSWECALIDITYPHSWVNFNKEFTVVLSALYFQNEQALATPLAENDKNRELMRALSELRKCEVVIRPRYHPTERVLGIPIQVEVTRTTECYTPKTSFTVVPGQYNLKSVLTLLQQHIREVGLGCEATVVAFDPDRKRVTISDNRRMILISCYKRASFFKLLGFGLQNRTNKNDTDDLLSDDRLAEKEYMRLADTEPLEAELPPFI